MKEKKEMQIVVTADDSKAKTKLQKLADYLKNNFEEEKKTKVEVDTTSSMQKLNDYLKELETVDQKLNKVFSSGKNYQIGDVNVTTSSTYLEEGAEQEFDTLSAKADELREKIDEIISPIAEGYKAEWLEKFENLDVSQTTSDLALTKAELIQINDRIASIKSSIKNIDREAMPEAFNVLARELEEAEQKAEELRMTIKGVDDSADDASKSFSTLGDKISKALNKASKKTNKFVLSLFSIRTVWSLISKASSTYLSENEATSNKVAAAWSYLGNLVGPIIEKIVGWLQYGIAYLNVFVKALSGVDLLAKSIKNTVAKTNKELKKTVSSMDEIVNLEKNEGTTNNTAGVLQEIADLELNQDVVDFLEDLAETLKIVWNNAEGVWNFLEEHFSTSGVAVILGGLALLLGNKGFGGLAIVLASSFVIDFIYSGITGRELSEDLQEIFEGLKDLKEAAEIGIESMEKIYEKTKENTENLESTLSGMSTDEIAEWINQTNNGIETNNKAIESMEEELNWINWLNGSYDTWNEKIELTKKQKEELIKQLEIAKAYLEEENKKLDENSTAYEQNKSNIENIERALEDLDGTIAETEVQIKPTTDKSAWEQFWDGLWFGIRYAWDGIVGNPSTEEYATGGFPNEGQMFIANEKGPELVGNIGSSTAVVNNQQIVDSVSIGVANAVAGVLGSQKSTSQNASYIYINGSEFAKAVYNDMENESLRRNKNTSIRRA